MAPLTRRKLLGSASVLGLGAAGVARDDPALARHRRGRSAARHDRHGPRRRGARQQRRATAGTPASAGERSTTRPTASIPHELLRDFDWGKTSKLPDGRTLREWTIAAGEQEIELAPGVKFAAWSYNGRIPGPTLRAKEGERLRIRFFNGGTHPHTMHFHGIHTRARRRRARARRGRDPARRLHGL